MHPPLRALLLAALLTGVLVVLAPPPATAQVAPLSARTECDDPTWNAKFGIYRGLYRPSLQLDRDLRYDHIHDISKRAKLAENTLYLYDALDTIVGNLTMESATDVVAGAAETTGTAVGAVGDDVAGIVADQLLEWAALAAKPTPDALISYVVTNTLETAVGLYGTVGMNALIDEYRMISGADVALFEYYHHCGDQQGVQEALDLSRRFENAEGSMDFLSWVVTQHRFKEGLSTGQQQVLARMLSRVVEGVNQTYQRLSTSEVTAGTPDLTPKLIEAVRAGDAGTVRRLLKAGADPNSPNDVLMLASDRGYAEIAEALVTAGADLEGAADDQSPLHAAAGGGHAATVRILLAAGGDPNFDDIYPTGTTPLIAASRGGHLEAVDVLLEAGADPNHVTDGIGGGGNTALREVASRGHAALVRSLLAAGADPNLQTENYPSPIVEAARRGHGEAVKILLGAGARASPEVLGSASGQGHVAVVRSLLDAGANPDEGLFPAAVRGHPQVVELLLDAGATVDLRHEGYHGFTALVGAAETGKLEVVRLLLEAGADPNANGGELGWTPLMLAAITGRPGITQALLEAGAHVNLTDNRNRTALDFAIDQGNSEVERLLRSHGAE